MKNNILEYHVLEQLFKYAETLGKSKGVLTVEKFFLAVVDVLKGTVILEYSEKSQEDAIKCLYVFFEYYQISFEYVKERISNYLEVIEDEFEEEVFMENILNIAHQISRQYNYEYVSPEFVLYAIIQNPTDLIDECLFSQERVGGIRDNNIEFEIFSSILQQSKYAANTENDLVTIEKFLWTICNFIENDSKLKNKLPSEKIKHFFINNLSNVFDFHEISPVVLKEVLTDYLNTNNCGIEDLEIMKNIINEVEKLTIQNNVKYISTEMVLDYIFDFSSETLNQLLDKYNEKIESERDSDLVELTINNRESIANVIDEVFEVDSDADSVILNEFLIYGNIKDDNVAKHRAFNTELKCIVDTTQDMQNRLTEIVFGQDNAINTFVSGFYQSAVCSLINKNRRKPYATFLFVGGPGVGKTFLAENISRILNLPFKRFDMSEYCDKESNLEFCGSDKVYKNAKKGNFTSFVMANPKSIVLFDEVEKSHPVIINLFLQMLDAGVIRDNFTDEEISLKDVLMIFTTNAGKQLYENIESGTFSSVSRKNVIKALQEDINPTTNSPYFPAAICSRFASGNVVMFNHITPQHLLNIVKTEIKSNVCGFQNESGIIIDVDNNIYSAILFSEGGVVEARTIKSRASAIFNNELFELFKHISLDNEIKNIEEIKILTDFSKCQPEIEELFAQKDKPKVLIFSSKYIANTIAKKTQEIEVVCARTIKEAYEIMRENEISIILIDLNYGVSGNIYEILNISDVESEAREFLQQLHQDVSIIPVYLLQTSKHTFTEEEKRSFVGYGVQGIVSVKSDACFDERIKDICQGVHVQRSMLNLSRSNKILSFETAQKLSFDQKKAEIVFFDFTLKTNVDVKDSKTILNNISKPDVNFHQVIGIEDAKQELEYFIEYLKNPKKYIGTGVKTPKGILLYGPSGTGKTLLAKAMAGESDVTFICAEGNQFLKGRVGEGAQTIHQLFSTARKYAPAILFIDEIDAIGKERTGMGYAEETLTALLTEMDGFRNQTANPVFVLAATNFEIEAGSTKSLDQALLRRFDRKIYIDLPNKNDRIRYMTMKINSNTVFNISNELIENIAIRSTGMSLADLESILELSLRMAIRTKKTNVTDLVLEEAFETFNCGEKKEWDLDMLLRVARHESGHAIICHENGGEPSYITIVPRGNHGGYMQQNVKENKHIFTKNELLAKIRTMLGGRAAEIVFYGEDNGLSTGSSSDLISATSLARYMVESYGMDDSYGITAFVPQNEITSEVRMAVNKILIDEMNKAIEIIKTNTDLVDELSAVLINENNLSSDRIKNILENKMVTKRS